MSDASSVLDIDLARQRTGSNMTSVPVSSKGESYRPSKGTLED